VLRAENRSVRAVDTITFEDDDDGSVMVYDAQLDAKGIGTEVYYPVPFHLQDCFKDLGYKRGDFPESERAAEEALAIPVYPELGATAQAYVVETINSFYRQSAG